MKEVFQSLDLSQLKFISRGCDLCGNENNEPLFSVPFLGHEFCFVRCPACSLVYQNPLLDKESRQHIYETLEYWEHKHTGSESSVMLNYYSYLEEEELRRRTAEIRIKWMAPHLPPKAHILDLGCSDGLFVRALSEAGYSARGIDISNTMISYGRESYQADISQADFEGDWPFQKPFDAITCFATLSNIINPSKVFKNIRKHLRPGGSLFFNFGDCNRLISRLLRSRLYLYRPTASVIFSLKTVREYCQKHGFRIREIVNDVQIVPLARLLGFLRIPGLIGILKLLGLEEKSLRMTLLTGYSVHATNENGK